MVDDTFVGVDIDGVILNTYDMWLDELNKRNGTQYKSTDIIDYDLASVFGVSDKYVRYLFSVIDDRKIKLIDDNCPKVIDYLRDNNFVIELITAHIPNRDYGQDYLLECLDHHRINYDYITFVDVQDHGVKGRMAHLYDFMVDDAPHHINSMGSETKAILYEQPYNVNVKCPLVFERVKTWSQLELVLLGGKHV